MTTKPSESTPGSTHPFQPHPEHAEAVNQAIQAIQQLALDQPDVADALRAAASTDEARNVLLDHGIAISNEALWRHRGSLLKDGQPTWRG
ncbi:hypothetical protein NZK32_09160 [Cyanobium sp. FGCU-52]|nr:hypothetical protein [Cyanobium sp. FGCU52]